MGREGEVVRALVPAFEARNPGLRVRVQQIPWSAAHEKLLTAYVGGALPDALQLGNTWIPELVALGALEPLDARIEASRIPREDFFAGRAGRGRRRRRDLGAALVRRHAPALLSRAISSRRPAVAEAPRTWAAWRAALAAQQARAGGGRPRAAAAAHRVGARRDPRAPARRRRCCATAIATANFASPAFRGGLRRSTSASSARGSRRAAAPAQIANLLPGLRRGLVRARSSRARGSLGELAPPPPARARGRLGDGAAARRRRRPLRPASRSPAARASRSCARSPRKDAAWRWLEFLSEPEQQIAFHRALGRPAGAPRSAWRDASLARRRQRARPSSRSSSACAPTPKVPEWERIASRIARHAEAAVRGERERRRRRSRRSTATSTACSRSGAGSSRASERPALGSSGAAGAIAARAREPGLRGFVAPALAAIARLLLRAGRGVARALAHRLRHLRRRRPAQPALRRPRQLRAARSTTRSSGRRSRNTRVLRRASAAPLSVARLARARRSLLERAAGARAQALLPHRASSCPW